MNVLRVVVLSVAMYVVFGTGLFTYAADVYVSASTGSDIPANDGSIGSPWASIGYAITSAPGSSGDHVNIHVAAGLYNETLTLSGYQSLLGGYTVDFSGRNVDDREDTTYATVISGGGADTVISFSGSETVSNVVSGFTIRDGSGGYGGGIQGYTCQATIENNTIKECYASDFGAGIDECHGVISNNIIVSNWSDNGGGGIANSNADIQGNYIANNTAAGDGGGLDNCDGLISENNICYNYASSDGGGLSNCEANITFNRIYNNEASDYGGAFYNCNPSGLADTINANHIYNNTAGDYGGALALCDGNMTNNLIYNNYADDFAGALYDCDGYIANNTIYGNSAQFVPGAVNDCNGVFINNIVWGNHAGGSPSQIAGGSTIVYCCIEDWTGGGTGNISDDPMLVQPDLGIFHLLIGSPCINSGDTISVSADYDGDSRPQNLLFDIGADEFMVSDTTPPVYPDAVRATPIDAGSYLEWAEASDPGEPLYYNIYIGTTSGGQPADPAAATLDNHILMENQGLAADHYAVVRASDAYGNETVNTGETYYNPSESMMNVAVYNHDFETPSPTSRDPLPEKPYGWSASSQASGQKATTYYYDDQDPYEGSYCALVSTHGAWADPGDLTISSLTSDTSIALVKDHTYAVSARVRRSQSQWARFILFTSGFGLIHTENIDALDDKMVDSGWEVLYFYFRSPSNSNAYIRIDSIVKNIRTEIYQSCDMRVDDVQVIDMGIETFTDIYNVTPPPPQYGIRNRYFDLGTESEISTLGGIAYTCAGMPSRWNIAMAVDEGTNHAPDYPLWGQVTPVGLSNTSGAACYVKAKAANTTGPSWPAIAPDGVRINSVDNNGQRHVLSFDYGAAGVTRPLLRVFMVKSDFSHYSSLFVDPTIGIPGNRMWPLTLINTPDFGDEFILLRFDNVTLGAAGSGVHTDETTAYIDNAWLGVVSQ